MRRITKIRNGTLAVFLLLLCASCAAGTASGEKVKGYAEFHKGDTVIVDGQRIVVTDTTEVAGTGRRAGDFEPIPLGYEVNVKGTRRDDGSIRAQEIEAARNRDTDIDVELKKSFDGIEALYLKKGRVVTTDEKGKVVEDLGKLLTRGRQVDRARGIAERLAPPSVKAEDFRIYVVENEEWNAMAAPNNSIYVFSGLLNDLDDDEVALVVGHELVHATHEHSRRQYEKGRWVQAGALVAAALAAHTIDDPTTSQIAQYGAIATAMALVNKYSRDMEDQADRVGMRYAYEAGYNVKKGPKLWKKFAERYGETPAALNFFLGNHSRASKRAELLAEEIENNYSGIRTAAAIR